MSNKSKMRERWGNLVMYINAMAETEHDADTSKEAKRINDEKYAYLQKTYSLSVKRKKITLFNYKKPSKHD